MLRVVPNWRERPALGKHATIGQFDILDPSTWFDSSSTDVGTSTSTDNSLLNSQGGGSGTSTLTDTTSGQTIDSQGNITSGGGGTTVSPSQSNTSPGGAAPPASLTTTGMDWTPWIWGGVALVAVGGIALIAMKGRKKNPSRRYRRKSGSRKRR